MINIKKHYHFYAAHRNEQLEGTKCMNLHGHTYYVTVILKFPDPLTGSGVTMEFSEIDRRIEPIIQAFDHTLLINTLDPLYKCIKQFNQRVMEKEEISMQAFAGQVTSAENLATRLYKRISSAGLPIVELRLKETKSSTVIYKEDARKKTSS